MFKVSCSFSWVFFLFISCHNSKKWKCILALQYNRICLGAWANLWQINVNQHWEFSIIFLFHAFIGCPQKIRADPGTGNGIIATFHSCLKGNCSSVSLGTSTANQVNTNKIEIFYKRVFELTWYYSSSVHEFYKYVSPVS